MEKIDLRHSNQYQQVGFIYVSSNYLKHKTKKQLEEFADEKRFVYPINLQKFLGCTYRTAERIIRNIKNKYQVTSKYVESNVFLQYVREQI